MPLPKEPLSPRQWHEAISDDPWGDEESNLVEFPEIHQHNHYHVRPKKIPKPTQESNFSLALLVLSLPLCFLVGWHLKGNETRSLEQKLANQGARIQGLEAENKAKTNQISRQGKTLNQQQKAINQFCNKFSQ